MNMNVTKQCLNTIKQTDTGIGPVAFCISEYGARCEKGSGIASPSHPLETCLRVVLPTVNLQALFPGNDNKQTKEKKMALKKKVHPGQMNFFTALEEKNFEVPAKPGKETINPNKIKLALKEAIARSPFDREEICRQLSDLSGRTVSVAMLNAYTSQARSTHQLPSDLLAPVTLVLGPSVLQTIADSAGCRVAERDEIKLARIGRNFLLLQQLQRQVDKEISDLPLMRVGA